MGKRANNEGSVFQRKDGRWSATFSVNGKRKTIYAKTQAEALTKLREVQNAIANGTYSEPSRMTVGDWLTFWLEDIAPVGLRESTLSTHRTIVNKTLLPALGDVRLQDARLSDRIQSMINARSRQGIAPATVRREVSVLTRALGCALDRQYISRMPKLVLPKHEQKTIEFLTREEIPRLLDALPDTTNGRALRFILNTGLRAEELCGLRWADIDADSMRIRQVVVPVEGKAVVQPPKSKSGLRTVPLNANALDLLDRQRRAQRVERIAAGGAWKGGNYVFATALGAPADRSNLNRTLYRALDNAQLKRRSVHALRHTFATLWVQSGQDLRTLSEIIGHANVSFTMQRYVHSDAATKRQGMDALASLL